MVCHTSALTCMATASSKQAHHHTSRHYSIIWCTRSEPPTIQARRFASVSTLAGATRGRVLFYPHVLGPRLWWRALRQGLAMRCTSGPVISSEFTPLYDQLSHTTLCPVNSHHSTNSKLTPLYDQRAHTTLRPASSHHSTTSELTPLYDQ